MTAGRFRQWRISYLIGCGVIGEDADLFGDLMHV